MNQVKSILWTGLGLAALLSAPPGDGVIAGEDVVPINVVYTLPDIVAPPGEAVTVPILIRSDTPVLGYAVSIDFDEELLQVEDIEQVWQRPDGENISFLVRAFDNSNETPGNDGVAEGVLVTAAVFSFGEDVGLDVDVDVEIARIHFRVSPEAPDGGSTEIRFMDGGQPEYCFPRCEIGEPVNNFVGVKVDDGVYAEVVPELAESFLLVDCRCAFSVVPDLAIFKRGDSNRDGVVNIADPTATLNALFLGSGELPCLDAADADDDGALILTDAIYTLNFLFLGGDSLPAPGPHAAGVDPTLDALGCGP